MIFVGDSKVRSADRRLVFACVGKKKDGCGAVGGAVMEGRRVRRVMVLNLKKK